MLYNSSSMGFEYLGDIEKFKNLLFYTPVLERASSYTIDNFINSSKTIEESDERIKYLINSTVFKRLRKIFHISKINFNLSDYDESSIVTNFYKDDFTYDEDKLIQQLFKNNKEENDIVFKTPFNTKIQPDYFNLVGQDKIEYLIKNTCESVLNDIFLKKYLLNKKNLNFNL